MIVSMWMQRDVITIEPKTRLFDAAQIMARRKVRRLPVLDGERLVGMVSRYDLARAFPPDLNPFAALVDEPTVDRTVDEIMNNEPVTITGDTPLEQAAHLMRARKVAALPVMRGERLVGLITESDIFRALIVMLGADRDALRITFDLGKTEDGIHFMVGLAARHGMSVRSLLTFENQGKRFAVVRLVGEEPPGLIDEIWASGHKVESVKRPGPPPIT